jgi:thioredoxin-like negative regulator of GroEL
MGCMEQEPINQDVERALGVTIEEIDAVQNPQSIKDYQLKVTPTIVLVQDSTVLEQFEGVVHQEQLVAVIKKYL